MLRNVAEFHGLADRDDRDAAPPDDLAER